MSGTVMAIDQWAYVVLWSLFAGTFILCLGAFMIASGLWPRRRRKNR